MVFKEINYENALIELFVSLGYEHIYAPEIDRDLKNPLYRDVLIPSLQSINTSIPHEGIKDALYKLENLGTGSLEDKNLLFMDCLQNGIEVKYFIQEGNVTEEKYGRVYLIDYKNIENNCFHVINQYTIIEKSNKRPDILIFINGIPLVYIECKSPSRIETDASEAYRQIRNYMHEIPSLFHYNVACGMSDLLTNKIGTITATEDRYMEWKTTDGNYESTQYADYHTFFIGIFTKKRFLDIIKNFICFSHAGLEKRKILAGYHQYFAVQKAIESTKKAIEVENTNTMSKKAGVIWHSTGSGKSLSMVFYAHLLQSALHSPTIVVITDRNDLDDQLYKQFLECKNFLRQTPQQAKDREDLKKLLLHREANGIIFTTIQKFEESDEPLSKRTNIILIVDEAHRSQYGLEEKVTETGKIKVGFARIMRNSLPNATFIAFTGTPISIKDRSTLEVFGDYIDIYDMTQAVQDNAIKPVYYESRVVQLELEQNILDQIDNKYAAFASIAEEHVIEQSKKDLAKMDAVLGAESTIYSLVTDILDHYEGHRAHLLTGKAIIVAYSRAIAMKIYHKIIELRPEWKENETVGVVMTSSNNDPEEWHKVIGNKQRKKELELKFKDEKSPLKIVIVVDMWLTGFDVPSLATMYVYKPMIAHNLIQAIMRVNRVYKEKEGGLVVDYIGIASALKQAMSDFTHRDKNNFGDPDIKKTALPKFLEKLSLCKQFFHLFDYSHFIKGFDGERAEVIKDALNFMLDPQKERIKNDFIREGLLLKQAFSLCSTLLNYEQRIEASFFETVRTLIVRSSYAGKEKISLKEMNDAVNNLLRQAIQSDGVINLFSDIKEEFSLFDAKFLEQISNIKQKNVAIELLRKLLAEKIKLYSKKNLVKSEKFSEIFKMLINKYINGHISNEEVIEELVKLAKEMSLDSQSAKELGLSEEEYAFYDAITKPAAIKDFYEHTELIEMTRELTDMLRKNRTIDWQLKADARAQMRTLIKRLLKKYKYPPEGQEIAIKMIYEQCELWVDNIETCMQLESTTSRK